MASQPSPWSPFLPLCQIPQSPVGKISCFYFPEALASSVSSGGVEPGFWSWELHDPSERQGRGREKAPSQGDLNPESLAPPWGAFCPILNSRPRLLSIATILGTILSGYLRVNTHSNGRDRERNRGAMSRCSLGSLGRDLASVPACSTLHLDSCPCSGTAGPGLGTGRLPSHPYLWLVPLVIPLMPFACLTAHPDPTCLSPRLI